jgi:hypothetical protein
MTCLPVSMLLFDLAVYAQQSYTVANERDSIVR